MASRSGLPAKLIPPAGDGLLERGRLLARLDAMRDAKCIWVCGPAGAGKSSLVASWIERCRRRALWYRVDGADGDPATLFHYLRVLSASLNRSRTALRPVPSEQLPGVEGFIRVFFEQFFALLPGPFLMVFDDCHEAPADSAFAAMLTDALNALPAGGQLICISREVPPPALADLWTDGTVRHIGWDELRFMDTEAEALGRLSGADDPALLSCAISRTRGWAAGLRMLLRAAKLGLDIASPGHAAQAVFDYLGSEVLNKTPPAVREFLLKVGLPGSVTARLAQQISGYEKAAETLAWLHRNRMFTERRLNPQADAEASYEFHPMFRHFLLERARRELPNFDALSVFVAGLLESAGRIEEAADLCRATDQWAALERLIRWHAPALAAEARVTTLEEWILWLPESQRATSSWPLYWFGVCRSLRDPVVGRRHLEDAYVRFRIRGEQAGAFLAVASLIASYMLDCTETAAFDRWVREFESLLEQSRDAIPEAVEVPVLSLLQGLVYRRPEHRMLPKLVQRAEELSKTLLHAGERLATALPALQYRIWAGDLAAGQSLCEQLSDASRGDVPVSGRILFGLWRGTLLAQQARLVEAKSSLREALELAQGSGLSVLVSPIEVQIATCALCEGDADEAERALEAGCSALPPGCTADFQLYGLLRAVAARRRGRSHEATALANEAAQLQLGVEEPFREAFLHVLFGQIVMQDGRAAEARGHFQRALEFARRMPSDWIAFPALLGLAAVALDSGDETDLSSLLCEALAMGSRRNFHGGPAFWMPEVVSRLFAKALEERIEVGYVRGVIRQRKLVPHSDTLNMEGWPWAVRIYSLGRFAVLVGDKPLRFSGRVQRKPLELLQVLIALGGRNVALDAVAEYLWPELEGHAAQNACNVARHRLRRLLGSDEVLEVREGRISIDTRMAWVDAWVFERLAGRVDALQQGERAPGVLADIGTRMIRLYQGHFLRDEEAPWAIAYRERLRSKFARAGAALCAILENAGRLDEAAQFCRRALELDPLAESFHRGLMRCLRERGEIAEALDAYRRCRHILSITLGIVPSADTQAIYRTLKD